MKWDWGEYSNTIFVFDYESKELILSFDNNEVPFYVSTGGVYTITLPNSISDKHPFGHKVTIVRAFQFNDDYYSEFEPGHKGPKLVQRCWRMLQLNRLNIDV